MPIITLSASLALEVVAFVILGGFTQVRSCLGIFCVCFCLRTWIAEGVRVHLFRRCFTVGTTGLQLQATVPRRLLLQQRPSECVEQTPSSQGRGWGEASYRVWVTADGRILFPVLWLKLYDDTEDLPVELIVQMNVMICLSFHCGFLFSKTKKYRKLWFYYQL